MDAMQNEIRNAFARHPMKRLATRRPSSSEPFGAAEILHGKYVSDREIDEQLEALGHVERLRPNRCHFDVAHEGLAVMRTHGNGKVEMRTRGDQLEIFHGSDTFGTRINIPWTGPGNLVAVGRVEAMRILSSHARSAIQLLRSARGRPSRPDDAVEQRLATAADVVATLAGSHVPGARLVLPSPWFAPAIMIPIAPVRTFDWRRYDIVPMDPIATLLATYVLPRAYVLGSCPESVPDRAAVKAGAKRIPHVSVIRGYPEVTKVIPGPLSIPVEPMEPIEAMRLLPGILKSGRPIGTRVAALLGNLVESR